MPAVESTAAPFEVSQDASLVVGEDMNGHLGTFYKTPNVPYHVWSARSQTNDILGLTRRLLRPVPTRFDPNRFEGATDYFIQRARQLRPMSREQLLECYVGAKKTRYALACENLALTPLAKRDFEISSFTKRERCNDFTKYPRMVHHRSYEAIFELLRYIKPLEHFLYKKKIRVNGLQSETTNVAKGLNGNRRAEIIRQKFESIHNCEVLSLDCSSFELHTSLVYLLSENNIMMAHYKHDKYFRWMCSNLLINFGRTDNGVRWSRRGGRVSGDAHTGFGNTLCMLLIVTQFAMDNPHIRLDTLSDGDDTLLFYEKGTVTVQQITEHFAAAGHELRVDNVTDDYEKILFCQHRFIDGVMVRDPKEILEKALTVTNSLTEISPRDYFASIGKGLKAVYGVIPEIRTAANMLIELNPDVPATEQYWLKHPQTGEIEVGRISDIFDTDYSMAVEEVKNLVSFL